MPKIVLVTMINAPVDRCFDLSRSIDLHKISTAKSKEEAIAGKTTGLLGLGESVTWRARHVGVVQKLTSQITEYQRPHRFVDEMVKGAFEKFSHEHLFQEMDEGTKMTDIFTCTSPLGYLGKLADFIFLKQYMEELLRERNQVIKEYAESDYWKGVLL